MLYLVPTPIGNLQDITLRALETLRSVDRILAEDTRTTGKLLHHFDIQKPMTAFHAHNEHIQTPRLVQELQAGVDMALVTDAGTPGISDPGFLLVRACRQAGVKVSCLPGPTAFVPALAASGLPSDKFHFEGFLPHKKGRQGRLNYLAGLPHTFVLYESPHRLVKCLEQLAEVCGLERPACVAREISKLHEEITTDTLSALIENYANRPVKGECVVVVAGTEYSLKNGSSTPR